MIVPPIEELAAPLGKLPVLAAGSAEDAAIGVYGQNS
jgi:hypothetical protein